MSAVICLGEPRWHNLKERQMAASRQNQPLGCNEEWLAGNFNKRISK
jgi:hypothetical protein